MFTGIVESLGSVISRDGARLRLGVGAGSPILDGAAIGDSTAVNGCCLTVVAFDPEDGWWEADVSDETYRRTSLGGLQPGAPVNLERPVRLIDRLGGHLVQGHVDAVGIVIQAVPDLRVAVPNQLTRYVVEKGSITVDGVSLTVVEVVDSGAEIPGSIGLEGVVEGGVAGDEQLGWFSVAVIPHTSEVTTLGSRRPGDPVNLEVDVMAKYAEKLLAGHLAAGTEETTWQTS